MARAATSWQHARQEQARHYARVRACKFGFCRSQALPTQPVGTKEVSELRKQLQAVEKGKAASERRLEELRLAVKESSTPAEVRASSRRTIDVHSRAFSALPRALLSIGGSIDLTQQLKAA